MDCDSSCAVVPWPLELVGACAHDQAAALPVREPGPGTGGSGGLSGTWDGTVQVRGAQASSEVDRHFRVFVPARTHPDTPTPVLFVLGGFTVDMYWLAEFTEIESAAERDGFIVVYGHAEYRDFGSSWVYAWYVYGSAFEGDWPDNPDLAYLEAVLARVGEEYNVDTSRVYVSGHSRGAGLSIIAAFERPDLFAGFCAQAGFVSVNEYDQRMRELAPDSTFAASLVHGDADPDVGVENSDQVAEILTELGWDSSLRYDRLPGATHEWQSQLNPQIWEFLADHPADRGAP
jgi:poly(3-hydroxybutyrate) depolymerase